MRRARPLVRGRVGVLGAKPDGGIASFGFVASLDRSGVVDERADGRDVTRLTGLTNAPIAGFAVAADQRMTTLQSGTTIEVYPDVRAGSYAILTLQKGESLLPTRSLSPATTRPSSSPADSMALDDH